MKIPKQINDNIDLPIIVAPMFLVSNDKLIIESCKNGIMAAYPFPNSKTIEELEKCIQNIENQLEIEKNNNKDKKIAPWVASIIVHSSYQRFDNEIEIIKKYKPQIVITALGSPLKVVEIVHSYGGLVFADVSNLTFAKKAINTGIDGLILLTSGAGGHTGYLNPFAFISEIKKIWSGLIILSGCINNANEIKAAQLLGVDLCYMGTRFIATNESMANQEYKQMITECNIDDIVLTNVVTGVNANFMKQSLDKANVDLNQIVTNKKLDFSDRYESNTPKAWKDIWSAGHGVGEIKNIQSVKQIIDNLKTNFNEINIS